MYRNYTKKSVVLKLVLVVLQGEPLSILLHFNDRDLAIVIIDNNVNPNNLISINRFECPDVVAYATDKCYLKGKTFNVGDDVTGDIVPSCRAACKCLKRGNESASIVCASVECPEHFGGRDWSCVSQYNDVKQCCRVGEICGKIRF